MTYEEFFDKFCEENNEYKDKDYSVYDYSKDEFDLIVSGKKVSEYSLYDSYIKYKEPLPVVGDVAVVVSDDSMCIIENTKVELVPISRIKDKKTLEEEAADDEINLCDESIVVVETFKVIKK